MKTFTLLFAFALLISAAMAFGGEAVEHTVFTADGKTVSFEAMADELAKADIVFVGEQHDHRMGHLLELEILKALHKRSPKQALSLEMFERDVQGVLDEYLAGYINESSFLASSRPWPTYKTDYRPMVEYCKENKLSVVAANAPRRYVNIVSRKGAKALEELPKSSRVFLPAVPFSLELPKEYDRQLTEIFSDQHSGGAPPGMMPSTENMKQAQSLWDESMKDSILRFKKANRDCKVVQMNGAMHSDSAFGIAARLKKTAPRLKVAIVTIKPDKDYPNTPPTKYGDKGDFVLVTPVEKPVTPAK